MNNATSLAVAPQRAVAYARFSTDMQRNESIDAQLRAIKNYASENNITVIGNYIDIAKSGKNDKRPEFQRMIRDSQTGNYDFVIVHKLDRFARSKYDSVHYRHELNKNRVKILSVLENYDSDSPEGILIESLYEGMNEYYIRNLSREIMKGLKENAYKAKFTGGVPPIGYDIDSELNYVINETEAEIVRLIYNMASGGFTYNEIISKLNGCGYRTKRGLPFGKNSIHDLLKNKKYCGIYEFNVTPTRNCYGSRNYHARKDEKEVIRIEGAIPSIVPKEIFDAVQKILLARKRRAGAYTAKEVYLLSGKVLCGKCGMAYIGHRKFNSDKKKYVVYSCGKSQRKGECSAKYIRREQLEGFVLKELSAYVFDDSLIRQVCELYKDYMQESNALEISKHRELKKRLKAIDNEICNVVN